VHGQRRVVVAPSTTGSITRRCRSGELAVGHGGVQVAGLVPEIITWLDNQSRLALHLPAHPRISAAMVVATFTATADPTAIRRPRSPAAPSTPPAWPAAAADATTSSTGYAT
jgi:hypothetical protein